MHQPHTDHRTINRTDSGYTDHRASSPVLSIQHTQWTPPVSTPAPVHDYAAEKSSRQQRHRGDKSRRRARLDKAEAMWSSRQGRDPGLFVRDVLDIHPVHAPNAPAVTAQQRIKLLSPLCGLPASYLSTITSTDANTIIAKAEIRRTCGLCSLPQARELWARGLRTDLTKAEAGEAFKALVAAEWNVTPDVASTYGYGKRVAPATVARPTKRTPKATKVEATSTWDPSTYDAAIQAILGVDVEHYGIRITPGQAQAMEALRLPKRYVLSLGYGSAKLILDAAKRRLDDGLCSYSLAAALHAHGLPHDVTGVEANRTMQRIAAGQLDAVRAEARVEAAPPTTTPTPDASAWMLPLYERPDGTWPFVVRSASTGPTTPHAATMPHDVWIASVDWTVKPARSTDDFLRAHAAEVGETYEVIRSRWDLSQSGDMPTL